MKDEITNKIQELLSRPIIASESEAAHLMILMRKRIEHMEEQERIKYPFLSLFCNWSLHINIKWSTPAMNIIQDINQIISGSKDRSDSALIDRLSKALSFNILRAEIDAFLRNIGANSNLATDDREWVVFQHLLIRIIHACPLEVPNKPSGKLKEIVALLSKKPIKMGVWVKSISILNRVETSRIIPLPQKDIDFFIIIVLNDSPNPTRIIVPLYI